MAIGKEGLYILEQLAREQRQIWPDSADIGIPATDSARQRIRLALSELPEKGKVNRWGNETSGGITYSTQLAIEQDGPSLIGYTIKVSEHWSKRGRAETRFFDIDLKHGVLNPQN